MDENQYEIDRRKEVSAVLSFVIAVGVLLAGFGLAAAFVLTREKPESAEVERPVPTVVAVPVGIGDHTVQIRTQGVVESRREVELAAQVAGRVERISDNLIASGRVEAGETLVWIETEDLRAAVARAESALEDAELTLEQERARREQAGKDWEKLGRGEASDLVLRKPQIESAEARVASARAELERARRDLERARIKAPFAGRVRRAGVEVGAVVAPGTMVAEIYSADDLEVRLPFSLEDFGFLRRDGSPRFEVTATLGGELKKWPAELVRIDGEVDRATLSGYGVAKLFANEEGDYPPVGLFVKATVPGRTLDDVAEVPRAAVRGGMDEVWVATPGGDDNRVLRKRKIEELRSRRETLIVRGDFEPDDLLVLTRLTTATAGDEVKIAEEPETTE